MPQSSLISSETYNPIRSTNNQHRYYIGISFRNRVVLPNRIQIFDLGGYVKSIQEANQLLFELLDGQSILYVVIDRVKECIVVQGNHSL